MLGMDDMASRNYCRRFIEAFLSHRGSNSESRLNTKLILKGML